MFAQNNFMDFRILGNSENFAADLETIIKCRQLNMHHCRDATLKFNEWMIGKKTSNKGNTNNNVSPIFKIGLLQEPYINEKSNKIVDFDRNLNIFAHSGSKKKSMQQL